MTLRQPPNWLQNGSYSANSDRLVINSLLATPGVAATDDLKVSATPTPSMSVNITAGAAFVRGTVTPATQGVYHCANDGTISRTVGPSSAGAARIDLVVLRVYDSEFQGTDNKCEVEVIAGSPSTSPQQPPAPANSIPLASVRIAAGTSSISQTAITDLRPFVSVSAVSPVANAANAGNPTRVGTLIYDTSTNAFQVWTGSTFKLAGGIWICTSTTRPANPYAGMEIWEIDTAYVKMWVGTYWKFQRFLGRRNDSFAPWGQWTVTPNTPSDATEKVIPAAAWTVNHASPVATPNGDYWLINEAGLYAVTLQHFGNLASTNGYQIARAAVTGGYQPLSSLGHRGNNGDYQNYGAVDLSASGTYYFYDGDRVTVSIAQVNRDKFALDMQLNLSITLIGG